MSLKTTLLRYTQFYPIYQESKKDNASDTDIIVDACKEHILKDTTIDKSQTFYYLKLSQKERPWQSSLCFSYGEAMARKTHHTHRRHTVKGYLLELDDAPIEAEIVEISLQEILEDEKHLSRLVRRMSYLVPFNEDEIRQMPEDYSLVTLWNFEHHGEAEFLFYDGKEFLYSTHKDAGIPSSMDYGYSTVIDDEGKYGIIHNKTILLSGDPDFEWTLPCEYYYIKAEGGLAEVQKKEPIQSDDFRDYLCDIIDLETKQVYRANALANSLEHDNYIAVNEEGLLQYVKVDTEKKTIEATSPLYSYIVTPIHYAPKPVQDATTKLWGYMDKECHEVISPQYKDWNFFNDGYAVLKEDDKYFVINETGEVIIKPYYRRIEHYEYGYFFVEDDRGWWAVFLKDKVYIDFIDVPAIEEVPEFNNFPYVTTRDEKYYIVLRHAMKDKKTALKNKRYELPLSEYIALFGPIRSERDLNDIGLLGSRIKVKKIPSTYENIIKKEDSYTIGWNYPVNANMFNMTEELPVIFTKVDGSDLTLGIALKDLILLK